LHGDHFRRLVQEPFVRGVSLSVQDLHERFNDASQEPAEQ
jgi:hypothetical protein